MDQKTWKHLENRAFLVILIIVVVFLLSAVGENKTQRQSPEYQLPSRGY